jgi:hypothetical protein
MYSGNQAERRIALIPRIVVQGKWGPEEYALLVTDKRSILVLEKGSKTGIAGALGGAVGAAIASAASSRKSFDYKNENPESFAINPKNKVIPHDSLLSIQLKKGFLGPVIRMEVKYQDQKMKGKTIKALLSPPGEHLKQKKNEGGEKKQIYYDYAKKVDDVYKQALSPPRYGTVMSSKL